ncbi:MAG: DUF4825 domain-containing protein [Clostridia bacterium]|nr:DUF4825 domain-containing protein [Clostridia bacterium]
MNDDAIKKPFYKKVSFYIVAIALIITCVIGIFLATNKDTRRLNLAGYVINVPSDWQIELEGEVASFYGEAASDTPIGKARLINTETAKEDFGKWFYFKSSPAKSQDTKKYAAPLTEQIYQENESEYTLYAFSSLPNPQPYHFVMYFNNEYVKKGTAKKILKSLVIPDAGMNPPPKNIAAPAPDELGENSVYKIVSEDYTEVHFESELDSFINHIEKSDEAKEISIFSYKKEGDFLVLDGWQHLSYSGKKTLIYKYYQTESGTYSYNNNPAEISKISKLSDEENDITRYVIGFADKKKKNEILFEIPKNQYHDNSAKLLTYMGTQVGDNSAVGAILDLLPTRGLTRTKFELNTDSAPYSITIYYDVNDEEKAYKDGKLDKTLADKNAAIIFSLVENADVIIMNIADEQLTYKREKIEKQFDADVREYSHEPKKFTQYVEKVQNLNEKNLTEQSTTDSSSVVGDVVYSSSVTISYNTKVTHPKTGKKVSVGPYAKRFGYEAYLGKPISCVIYRATSGYKAVASCGGAVLLEYSLADEAALNNAIATIHAYGG